MTKSKNFHLFIKSIDLQKAYGKKVSPFFDTTALSPFVNIFYGPNSSGKTTLATAVQALFWQENAPFVLSAELEHNEKTWSVALEGSSKKTPLSFVPEKIYQKCYFISLSDLLQSEDSDLATLIQKEVQGGFDLQKIKDSLDLSEKAPSTKIKEYKELLNARENYKKATYKQNQLESSQKELQELKKEALFIEQEKKLLSVFKKLLEYHKSQKVLKEVQESFEKLNPLIANLSGNELPLFDSLQKELLESKKELKDLQKKQKELSSFIEKSPLINCQEQDEKLSSLWQTLSQLEDNLKLLTKEILAQETEEKLLREQLGKNLSAETLASIDLKVQNELFELFQMHSDLKSKLQKGSHPTFYLALLGFPLIFFLALKIDLYFGLLALLPLYLLYYDTKQKRHLQKLKQKEKELLARKDKILASEKLFLDTPPILFVTNLQRWQNAYFTLSTKRVEKEQFLEQQLNNTLQEFNNLIFPILGKNIKNSLDGKILLQNLSKDLHGLALKKEKLIQTNALIQIKEKEHLALEQKLQTLLSKFTDSTLENLEEAPRKTLQDLLEQKTLFCKLKEEKEKRAYFHEKARLELFSDAGFKKGMLEYSLSQIEDKINELELQEKHLEEIKNKIISLETALKIAKDSDEVEGHLAKKSFAENALHTIWQNHCQNLALLHLLQFLQNSVKKTASCNLLRAQELFFQISAGAYELILGDNLQFLAKDSKNNYFNLNQLSSATKLQLLLAVRLSFLESIEKNGMALPLILDEVLNTSDPAREEKIMQSLTHIAKSGRQIFYFTAQKDEFDKWNAILNSFTVI